MVNPKLVRRKEAPEEKEKPRIVPVLHSEHDLFPALARNSTAHSEFLGTSTAAQLNARIADNLDRLRTDIPELPFNLLLSIKDLPRKRSL